MCGSAGVVKRARLRTVWFSTYAGSNPVSRINKMKTNPHLKDLIKELKTLSIKNKVGIWKAIAKELEKSTRRRRAVNLSKIDKVAKDKEIIVVPGKVLGNGELKKDITIAAYEFSESANQKIKNKLTIKELMSKDPKTIRIIG